MDFRITSTATLYARDNCLQSHAEPAMRWSIDTDPSMVLHADPSIVLHVKPKELKNMRRNG